MATSHANELAGAASVVGPKLVEVWRPLRAKQAMTNTSSAIALRKLVSFCVPLPARTPIQFKKVSKRRNAIATVVTPAKEGANNAIAYSAKAIGRKATAAALPSQSLQPTTNPAKSP